MALSANTKYRARMSPGEFGGLVASGVHIYEGALCAWKSDGTIVRVGDNGAASFAGMASGERDNPFGAKPQPCHPHHGARAVPCARCHSPCRYRRLHDRASASCLRPSGCPTTAGP